MDAREVKAWEMTGDQRVSFRDGAWHVHSQTTSRYYRVNPSPAAPACECEDFALRAQPCKHKRHLARTWWAKPRHVFEAPQEQRRPGGTGRPTEPAAARA